MSGACNVTGNVRARVLPVKALQAVSQQCGGSAFTLIRAKTNASGDGLAKLVSGENPHHRSGSRQRELVGPRPEAHTKADVEVPMHRTSRTREAVS